MHNTQNSEAAKPCIVCHGREHSYLFTKNEFPIYRCNGCGLERVTLIPGAEDVADIYSSAYYKGMSGGQGYGYLDYEKERNELQLNFRRHVKYLTRHKASGRILDVGCAMGFFMETLGDEWESDGVDVSEHASEYARRELGLAVKTGSFLEADYPDDHYDAITMWDAIEHLTQPDLAIEKARSILKKDGVILIVTGDAKSLFARIRGKAWRLYNPPQHLWFFSRNTLTKLLENKGFETLDARAIGRSVSRDYLLFVLSAMLGKSIMRYCLPAVKLLLSLKKTYTFNFGDIVLIVARKK